MLFLQVSFTISIIMIPNLKGKRALLNILIQYFIETLSIHELVVTKDEGKGRHNNRSSKKKKKHGSIIKFRLNYPNTTAIG